MSDLEPKLITPEMAAQEILFRQSARENLIDFARYTQKTYEADPFHYLLAEYLEKVERGEIDRLMINTPPRHGKSELASIKFPAWFMARNPNRNVIQASYNLEQATRSSRFTRDIIEGDYFDRVFPEVKMSPQSRAADRWMLDRGQEYFAVGVGTGATGKGGHCLTAETRIETENGPMTIAEIVALPRPVRVLSYDHDLQALVWKRCVARAERIVDGIYRITTTSGRVVEASAEHPFYANGRYIPASEIAAGDRLVRAVRVGCGEDGLRVRESGEARNQESLLWEGVLVAGAERGEDRRTNVSDMFCGVADGKIASLDLLLGSLSGCCTDSERKTQNQAESAGSLVRVLQHDVSTAVGDNTVLLAHLQGSDARLRDDGTCQSELAGRCEPGSSSTTCGEGLQEDQTPDLGKRFVPMRGVQLSGGSGGASHQHERLGQSVLEPRDAVRDVSHDVARCGAFETQEDFVALVEFVRVPTQVFNIQVDGTENFFAEDILTHNCFIIDDPHKDSEEADSPTMREKVWDWYNSVVYTRLERGGSVIVIQTRWHHDDLSGRLLANAKKGGDKWVELNLPAICMDPETDLMGRELGQALSPGRKNERELERIRENLTPRFWSAMFQQQPVSDEGAMFRADWFEETNRIPLGMKRVRAWDFGSNTDGDYTAGVLMARDKDGVFYIEDVIRERVSHMKVEQLVLNTALNDRKKYGSVQIIIPQDPGQAGVVQASSYIRKLAGYRIKAIRPTGDKETRASGLAAQAEARMVKIKPALWNKAFLEELSLFPLGTNDDQVDAAADAFNGLLGPGRAAILDW